MYVLGTKGCLWMKQNIIYIAIAFIAILLLIFVPNLLEKNKVQANQENQAKPRVIDVEIKGAIKMPGRYILKDGLALEDLIRFAMGTTIDADISNIQFNLRLENGQSYVIPKINDENSANNTKVNINKASIIELMSLKGVGEQTAQKIITYRQTNGPFLSIEEIKNVSGIGNQTYENIKALITT